MNSSRQFLSQYRSETLENSVLEWICSFPIENPPNSIVDIYQGVAVYEVLNKIDPLIFPNSKLVKHPNSDKQCITNYKNLINGLEAFYQQKLDSLINSQTSLIDYETMIYNKEFNIFLDLLELIVGVVINCDEKEQYIQQILDLDDKTQEDLQKLIEKALSRLAIELSEPSIQSDATVYMEFQKKVDSLEKERKHYKEKIIEIENELRTNNKAIKEKDEKIKNLEFTVQQLQYEKNLRSSHQDLDISGKISGMGELEAQLNHSKKQVKELEAQLSNQKSHYKEKIKNLKEELETYKEIAMQSKKNETQLGTYKNLIEEAQSNVQKLRDLQDINQKQSLDITKLEFESKDYKLRYEQVKKKLQEVQQQFTSESLEIEKNRDMIKQLEMNYSKKEQKIESLKLKYQNAQEQLEQLKTKLEIYEENKDLLKHQQLFDDYDQEDLQDRIKQLENEKKEIENQNTILKMSDQSELNSKILELESQIFEQNKENQKLLQQISLKDNKLLQLEQELEILREHQDKEIDQKDQRNDLAKELLKLRVEKDQWKEKMDKAIKKLEKKKLLEQEIKQLKQEKNSLEEEIRKAHREKSDEKEHYLKMKEEKIKLESQVITLESRISTLEKDNKALEQNLGQYKDLSLNAKTLNSETMQEFQIIKLEKERDQLKWAQEKNELMNKVNEFQLLIKQKEQECKIIIDQQKQRSKDEIQSIEDSYKEHLDTLREHVKEKDIAHKFADERTKEQDKEHNRVLSMVSSQFYNLAYEHNKSQKAGKTFSFLDQQRNSVYYMKYNQIFGPN